MLKRNKKSNDEQFSILKKSPALTGNDFRLFQSIEALNRALERKNEQDNKFSNRCLIS